MRLGLSSFIPGQPIYTNHTYAGIFFCLHPFICTPWYHCAAGVSSSPSSSRRRDDVSLAPALQLLVLICLLLLLLMCLLSENLYVLVV